MALGTVVVVADQSETTTPLNPQSPLSTSCRRTELAVIVAPLTPLYAAMTSNTSPSPTQASKGGRYSSLSTRSEIRALYVRRWVSESLAT